MQIINNDPIEIVADDGMVLTNGEAYSDHVYLAFNDSVDNWHEVGMDEVHEENDGETEDEKMADIARILLGITR